MSNLKDIFISHASEDKVSVARPLYRLLTLKGYSVWFDEFELKLGDSLRAKIDEGLSSCRFGVVVISPSFLNKQWPKRELDGLFSKEEVLGKVILPVWHDVEYSDVVKFSPILAGRLAVKSSAGLDKVVNSIVSTIGTPKESQPDILPTDLVFQSYADACEGEELFLDFCIDVSEKEDFLKNISISLRKGLVAQDKAQRIIENLSSLFLRGHLRLLFELICLIYDVIPTSDEVIRRMVNRGLSKSDIVEATHFIPKTASMNFCRRVFDAFYNQGIDPLRFESALFSPPFVDYCLHFDLDRTWEIVDGWKKKFDSDYRYLISDAVACILYMIDNAGDENTKHRVSGLLRLWRKSGVLDSFMDSEDYQVSKVRQATW